MKKKIFIGGAIALLIVVFIIINVAKNNNSTTTFAGGRIFDVKIVKLAKGSIASSISSNGVVEEIQKAEVFFDTPLRVKKLLVEKDQSVHKGQKLLEVDIDDLNSQLEQLKVNENIQQLAIDAASSDAEVTRAANSVKDAQRAYEDCKNNFNKSTDLYNANAISKSELDADQKAMTEADSVLENTKFNYQVAVSNKDNQVRSQQENLKATQLKISDLKNSMRKIEENLVSPIDGKIGEINVEEGSYTSNMQAAFKIFNPDKLQIRVKVSEFNIKSVAVGQKVAITGDAIDKEDTITGKVVSISPQAVNNMTSAGQETVVEVVVSINNLMNKLKPGLNVTCDITTQNKNNVLVSGMEVFDEDKDGNNFAYVVDEKNKVMHKKPVKFGIISDMKVEVTEGLKVGDVVVNYPQPTYKDGARIRITKDDK